MLSHLLTHLNPYSSEKPLLAISDLTFLEMGLCELSINYMSCVFGISKHMQEDLMDQIISLFAIGILDHDLYPGVKSRYLEGNPALVNCNLLDLSGLLSSKENSQQSLGLQISTPTVTLKRVSDAKAQPSLTGRPQPRPSQLPPTTSPIDYPQQRGVPWKRIT